MATDRIVAFYDGGTDNRRRTLDEMLAWSNDELESVHDYIQWMFPTTIPSGVNPSAPLITPATVAAFAARQELRDRLRQALDRMLAFYGLCRETKRTGEIEVDLDPDGFPERAGQWLHAGNHNHLRLTRIMQSIAALGLPEEARALQRCLLEYIYDGPGSMRVSRETYEHWLAAVPR